MKKVVYSGLALLVLVCLTGTAWAQKGGRGGGGGKPAGVRAASHGKASTPSASKASPTSVERSNKGGEVRGQERAEEVQSMNTKADTERGFTTAAGLEQAGQPTPQKEKARQKVRSRSQERGRDQNRDRERVRERDQVESQVQ